jgi:hypothetical protein
MELIIRRLLLLAASMLVLVVGCIQAVAYLPGISGEASTASPKKTKPVAINRNETFNLRCPAITTRVKRGRSHPITIVISRGSEFKDSVSISFSDVPRGVVLEPTSKTLGINEKEMTVVISANAEAPLGEFSFNVKGHPLKGGPDASNRVRLGIAPE